MMIDDIEFEFDLRAMERLVWVITLEYFYPLVCIQENMPIEFINWRMP